MLEGTECIHSIDQVIVLLREHEEGLGLNTSSFTALDLFILSWVSQHPTFPGVDIDN
jgi:hypothetical protein